MHRALVHLNQPTTEGGFRQEAVSFISNETRVCRPSAWNARWGIEWRSQGKPGHRVSAVAGLAAAAAARQCLHK